MGQCEALSATAMRAARRLSQGSGKENRNIAVTMESSAATSATSITGLTQNRGAGQPYAGRKPRTQLDSIAEPELQMLQRAQPFALSNTR